MRLAPTAVLLSTLLPAPGHATPPRQPDAAALARAIDRLSVAGNVLYVAAHPDDENTRLLAWLANDRQLHTTYLSLTRGEGGQNLIGSEQGPLLGLIRTQELLAARAIDGADQLFTSARDFGYSKTAAETLATWNKNEILADVVLQIRSTRPDVIFTRFPPTGGDTHGHHTASAQLALEAFRLAADPTYRPDQVQLYGVWQARRIVWNKSLWNQKPTDNLSKFMKLDVGGYSPALGLSWGEMAAASRSMHKSQGFGAAPTRGQGFEYFQVLAGDPATQSPFEGIDATWSRVRGSEKLMELLKRARTEFRPAHPEQSIPLLVAAAREIAVLPENPWKEPKKRELDQVIQWCAGLFVEVTAADFSTTPGGKLAITYTAINRSPAPILLSKITWPEGTLSLEKPLPPNEPVQIEQTIEIPGVASLGATLAVKFDGYAIVIGRPIVYKWIDPVAGERQRDVEVLPPVTLNPASPTLLFPDRKPRDLHVTVHANAAASGTLRVEPPAGFTASPSEIPFKLDAKADQEAIFHLTPPASASTPSAPLRILALANGKPCDRSLLRIEHAHIPIQTLLPPAEVKLVRFDLARNRARIGYIPGAGDEVVPALRQAGYDVTLLTDEALRDRPLAPYEAIVTGVRAFNVNPRLPSLRKKLLGWMAAGGTLVVQYNTNNRLSKLPPEIGPQPFEITQDRVTDETAQVTFALPKHPILSRPNRLSPADFEGWIQERGLYFADKFGDAYQAPLSMHDPNEPPRTGSLIVARHGKGAFVYTGLSFFRQLPAGIPGAFRLFANLLAHGK